METDIQLEPGAPIDDNDTGPIDIVAAFAQSLLLPNASDEPTITNVDTCFDPQIVKDDTVTLEAEPEKTENNEIVVQDVVNVSTSAPAAAADTLQCLREENQLPSGSKNQLEGQDHAIDKDWTNSAGEQLLNQASTMDAVRIAHLNGFLSFECLVVAGISG
jgi:hypothetical protein